MATKPLPNVRVLAGNAWKATSPIPVERKVFVQAELPTNAKHGDHWIDPASGRFVQLFVKDGKQEWLPVRPKNG
jgi:hypothetical protein